MRICTCVKYLLLLLMAFATSCPLFAQADSQEPRDSIRTNHYKKDPDNIKTVVVYDWQNKRYIVKTMLGDTQLGYAVPLTQAEYTRRKDKEQRIRFFREKNKHEQDEADGNAAFDLMDMQFSLGPAEKLFGPGGIRVKTQGSASLSMGLKNNFVDNPTLSEDEKDQWTFDFKEDVQLNMKASIGTKMSFGLNYNTDATFSFDASQMKLGFEGDEDDIVKDIAAGNVSMTTGNSLIPGGAALFGVKTKLQFGKLDITAMLAKQESTSKTVSSQGGVTRKNFELQVTEYDENRHFWLNHEFRNGYDKALSLLPMIQTGVQIVKVEVWMTNKQGNYTNARNIVADSDLGETDAQYKEGLTESVESARLLSSNEYSFNAALGTLSLKSRVDDDCLLAVAYQYTRNGHTYQVGQLSSDVTDTEQPLNVKMLKSTMGSPLRQDGVTPSPLWDLMMKNVYSLGVTSLQRNNFSLNVQYLTDSVGTFTSYVQTGSQNTLWIKALNADQLNQNQERHSDGQFDWLEGYTVLAQNGRIIFPVCEPFSTEFMLSRGIDASRYAFDDLYRRSQTDAQQSEQASKYRIQGTYSASSGSEINLGAMNVARGSVRVTAGGTTLTEGSDYTVDYTMGIVTILNESIIESGTGVSVSLEDQSDFSLQRRTMMGLDLQYNWSKNLKFGGTIINLSETPLTTKVTPADIPVNNTIFGFNLKWNKEFMWLTNAVGSIPWINATAPSSFQVEAEFAKLIAGHSNEIGESGYVYIDDFESSKSATDISAPVTWQLASTPVLMDGRPYPDGSSMSTDYNQHRAHLSWYKIDNLFTSQNSTLTPGNIRGNVEELSDHRVRQVDYTELYPDKDLEYGATGIVQPLNLTFYPDERGAYNLSASRVTKDGRLADPASNWGGLMRAMPVTNFETQNFQYIEFWMMDPRVTAGQSDDQHVNYQGGKLIFHLGDISEDILKDNRKSFENGLDVNGDKSITDETPWGRVSRRTSTVYAFDNSTSNHSLQDVGLDGVHNDEEKTLGTYGDFYQAMRSKGLWDESEPFNPLSDPAGDNYMYSRSTYWDEHRAGILQRYKYINGTEGNSESGSESYSSAYKSTPDVEDLNGDNTLNYNENFYEYVVDLDDGSLRAGVGYIVDEETRIVPLRKGGTTPVKWFLIRIPLTSEMRHRYGTISSLKSIRFMRIMMTGWQHQQTLRLGTLELVRSDWRLYQRHLKDLSYSGVLAEGEMNASTVNIEEHASAEPVNYVLPPGVSRQVTPGSTQVKQNEQAMCLDVIDLAPHNARAVYKASGMDLRRYDRLQLFAHAHAPKNSPGDVASGDMAIFLRIGSDYDDNYYEYEVPLQLTEQGHYSSSSASDRLKVWPERNMINVSIETFTGLKKERNYLMRNRANGVSLNHAYVTTDPDNRSNRITIKGNPSLSDASVLMIGVRNISNRHHNVTVWVNELRTDGMDEDGGWAARGNATLRISDLATVSGSGSYRSTGWGTVEQSTSERSMTEDYEYQVSTQTDAGRWLPKQLKLIAPVYYSYQKSVSTPKYDPYNEDLTIDETLDTYPHKSQQDSIKDLVQTVSESHALSVTGVRFDVKSKHSMPWDPANFTFGYSQNLRTRHDPTTEYERDNAYRAQAAYSYSPYFKPLQIAKKLKFNWLPNQIALSSNLNRTYHEEQLRRVSGESEEVKVPVSYTRQFTWLRQSTINWDITDRLKMNFQSATNARIDEPDVPVNKAIYPDEYEVWKDSVWTQIWKLGTPVEYNQQFDLSWQVPVNLIPGLDWVTTSAKYRATYSWNRGTQVSETLHTGNTIQNNRQWQVDGRLNLTLLYNKSKWLKRVNDKFKPKRRAATRKKNNKKKVTYDDQWWYKTLQVAARIGMSIQSIQVGYKETQDTYLPYFRPNVGDAFGEGQTDNGLAPGLGFAFGLEGGEDFVNKAQRNGWLICDSTLTSPANYTRQRDFSYQLSLEPWTGLKIQMNGSWRHNHTTSNQFMSPDLGVTESGSFQMTTIGLASSFGMGSAGDGYSSRSFDKFMQVREVIHNRRLALYEGTRYPTGGFIRTMQDGTSFAGFAYSGKRTDATGALVTDARRNSSDVLVPAFISAYMGYDAHSMSLSPFPSLMHALPNWKVTYDGLLDLFPAWRKYFKTLSLTHTYQCTYAVGSYQTYANYVENDQGLGFVLDVVNNCPVPAQMYDVGVVTLTESFSPLAGLNATLVNNVSARAEYRHTRTTSLNVSSLSIVENVSKDFTLGVGYKMPFRKNDLNMRLDMTYRNQMALLRKISTAFSEATSGNTSWNFKFSADYQLSKMLQVKLYYDRQVNTPLISSSYTTINSNFGGTLTLNLTR